MTEMCTIAYVVSLKFGALNISQVTVERETEKSYILKSRTGNRPVISEDIVGQSSYVSRVFPKIDQIFFSRNAAIEYGAGIQAKLIASIYRQLAGLEELQAQLTRELDAQETIGERND